MECCKPLRLDLQRLATKLRAGAALMVGQPDYDVYAKHRRENHPHEPIMSREEFFLERQARRFGEGGERAFRCC
ncbi:MAG: YbdD/YjiX family protein [Methylocystis sp.]